jgi:hypothetical protein
MHRDVVEDPNFADEFDLLRNVYPHMESVHAAITWTLSSDPRIGTLIENFPHPTIRLFKTTPIGATPGFLVLYRFTADQVILLAIDRL